MEPVPPDANAYPDIARLRTAGWTVAAMADAIGASEREVYRWARGVEPILVYRRLLALLPDDPPRA
jgi:hypothetical protein